MKNTMLKEETQLDKKAWRPKEFENELRISFVSLI